MAVNITKKELTGLKKLLNLENKLYVSYKTLSEDETDPQAKILFWNLSSKHKQHFDLLKGYLS